MTRDAWLWFGTAAGPVAWFGDLVVSYAVAPGPHRRPDAAILLAISGAALVLACAGALVAWRQLRAGRPAPAEAAPRPRFLAEAGLAMSGLAIALVIATALPTLILLPGGEP